MHFSIPSGNNKESVYTRLESSAKLPDMMRRVTRPVEGTN